MSEVILKIIGYLCILNFILFAIISQIIGGNAYFGGLEDGHYFISLHGTRRVEVSETIYNYSRLHFASQFITLPLAICMGYLTRNSPYSLVAFLESIFKYRGFNWISVLKRLFSK